MHLGEAATRFAMDPRGLQKLVGLTVAAGSFFIAVLNFLGLTSSSQAGVVRNLLNLSVIALVAGAAVSVVSAFWASKISRWMHVGIFFVFAYLTAATSQSGNLTSALFLIYGLVLIAEYRLGRSAIYVAIVVAAIGYPYALSLGLRTYTETFGFLTAAAMLAVATFVLLYGGIVLRHELRHRQEALTLESRVKERTSEIESALEERQVMLREIHHRVKNNLQVIASLLKLESAKVQDPAALSSLDSSVQRIHAMALVHETLYESEALHRVDLGGYTRELVGGIGRTLEGPLDIDLVIHEEALVEPDFAIPYGLLLTELVTNAAKYAYPLGSAGRILVELHCGAHVRLEVEDRGVGLPPDFNLALTKSLGFTIVRSIVEQLAGRIELDRSIGTKWIVSLEPGKIRRSAA